MNIVIDKWKTDLYHLLLSWAKRLRPDLAGTFTFADGAEVYYLAYGHNIGNDVK